MRQIKISASRDALDDLFAKLRADFEADRIPTIVAEGEPTNLRIEFLEVPETSYALEYELDGPG